MRIKKIMIIFMAVIMLWGVTAINTYADENAEHVYIIKVNRVQNCVTIYLNDPGMDYATPYKSMTCSTAAQIENTPLGSFTISEKKDWGKLVDGSWGQYCSRVEGQIMIHSVPYTDKRNDSLEVEEYNKLGEPASLGCIRLRAVDAQWIYDNCKEGTEVVIYDDEVSAGPLGKPDIAKIPEGYENEGWDPTDTNPDNPWNNLQPVINGATDIDTDEGESVNLTENISAVDIFGADIRDRVRVDGDYDFNVPGEYELQYVVTDGYEHSATVPFKLTVRKVEEETTEKVQNIKQKDTEPKTGVGPVMKIIFFAVCTFAVATLIVKKK